MEFGKSIGVRVELEWPNLGVAHLCVTMTSRELLFSDRSYARIETDIG